MSEFVAFEPAENRRMIDPAIEVIVHKVTRMATDMDKLAASIEKMSDSMSRLVLAEERINQVMMGIERVNKRLDEGNARFKVTEERLNSLEKMDIGMQKTTQWVDRGILGILGALGMFILHKIGLI